LEGIKMNLTDKSCVEFTEILASKSPVPGGGAASALVGAVGTALGSMVCNLTIGKKKVC
jgi:formiminotetrahydrofolate cyclodeaminase